MDFAEGMRQWRRMCVECSNEDEYCACDRCPLKGIVDGSCGGIYEEEFADVADFDKLAETVEKWAKEHPEPVYQTWKSWLKDMGVVETHVIPSKHPETSINPDVLTSKIYEAIPANIAEKLGLKPVYYADAWEQENEEE